MPLGLRPVYQDAEYLSPRGFDTGFHATTLSFPLAPPCHQLPRPLYVALPALHARHHLRAWLHSTLRPHRRFEGVPPR